MAHTDHAKDHLLTKYLYVGLFSIAPTDAGGGTELAGAGDSRQPITWTRTTDTAVNAASIRFENAGQDWDQVGWVGLFDAVSGGALWQWQACAPFTNRSGRSHTFAAGDLEVRF